MKLDAMPNARRPLILVRRFAVFAFLLGGCGATVEDVSPVSPPFLPASDAGSDAQSSEMVPNAADASTPPVDAGPDTKKPPAPSPLNDKYWAYRLRLVTEFEKLSYEQGGCLVADSRVQGAVYFGDTTSVHGRYMATLATELALLRQNGLDTAQVVKEIDCSLAAMNRLGLQSSGFFMRDDVSPRSVLTPTRPVPPGANVRVVDTGHISGVTAFGSDWWGSGKGQNQMSQDQIAWLMLGYRLLVRYLGPSDLGTLGVVGPSGSTTSVSLREEARRQARIMLDRASGRPAQCVLGVCFTMHDWVSRDDDGNVVGVTADGVDHDTSSARTISPALVGAAGLMGLNLGYGGYPSPTPSLTDFQSTPLLLVDQWFNRGFRAAVVAVSDYYGSNTPLRLAWLNNRIDQDFQLPVMVQAALHDSMPTGGWNVKSPCDAGLAMPYCATAVPANDAELGNVRWAPPLDVVRADLEAAPLAGPNVKDLLGWRTANRYNGLLRFRKPMPQIESSENIPLPNDWHLFNGLDFMLMYNLYLLVSHAADADVYAPTPALTSAFAAASFGRYRGVTPSYEKLHPQGPWGDAAQQGVVGDNYDPPSLCEPRDGKLVWNGWFFTTCGAP
jgi:hypothetical protein